MIEMIIIGSDHAGFQLKEKAKKFLEKKGEKFVDVGAFSIDESDDFSHYVSLIADAFEKNPKSKIISFCGSGVGINFGLNKHKNIRSVLGQNKNQVALARKHNNVNALSLAGRKTPLFCAKRMINAFLETENLGGKYERRMKEIEIK